MVCQCEMGSSIELHYKIKNVEDSYCIAKMVEIGDVLLHSEVPRSSAVKFIAFKGGRTHLDW